MSAYRANPSIPDLVMLSSIDWDFAWQRHQVFAALLSRWSRVFFIENTGFRSLRTGDWKRIAKRLGSWLAQYAGRTFSCKNPVPDRVVVVPPMVLPPGHGLAGLINARILLPFLLRSLHNRGLRANPILWTYLPTRTSLSIIQQLRPSAVIYDCVCNFYGHPDAPSDLEKTEKRLLQVANVVLADSTFLFQRYSGLHPQVYQLHHGVDWELFVQANKQSTRPRSLCYFGSIDRRLDLDIIRGLAASGFEIGLIGPIVDLSPGLPPTVHIHPLVPPLDLVKAIAPYQAIFLPYRTDTLLAHGIIPAKIYECLATGKPVLSSPLLNYDDELRRVLYLCADKQSFIATAEQLQHIKWAGRQEQQLALAKRHSHQVVARQLADILSFLKVL